jgi:serine/threonine-protein kinase
MGVVVAALQRDLNRLVALKFMHVETSKSTEAVERFLREARAAAALKSEHVGLVFDCGRLPGGAPYMVMEYLEGRDLDKVLKERGPLPIAEAVEYVLQACEAMAEAHARSIVHRDLKPQNLFLTTRPNGRSLVKVLDFGISKSQFATGMTATDQVMGTVAYMPPEQIRETRSVDARADIWSLGVILYQLLTRSLPFTALERTELMFKIVMDDPVPITTARPGLPAGLVAVIDRCLQKDRDKRFADVAELAHELLPFAPERARAAIALIERVVDGAAPERAASHDDAVAPARREPAIDTTLGGAASSIAVSQPRPPTSRASWIIVGVAGVVVVTIIAFVATRDDGGNPQVPARSADPPTASTGAPDAGAAASAPDAAVAVVSVDAGPAVTAEPKAATAETSRRKRKPKAKQVEPALEVERPGDPSPDAGPPKLEAVRVKRNPDAGTAP